MKPDAPPVTYKQVLRTAGTGWDDTHAEEHILSICLALGRSSGGRPFAISQSALHDIADLPADEWSGHPDGREPSEFPRPTLRPIDPPTCPPMTIRDRRTGQSRIDQPSMSRPLQRGLAREHRCDSTFDGLVHNHRSQVCSETFQGDVV